MIWVVDASVAVKWSVREELHEEALRLFDSGADLCAPDFIVIEVANIAWKKAIRNEISHDQAMSIAATVHENMSELYFSVELIERAMQIALSLDHPIYDCLYMACAENAGGALVTADRRLCSKVEDTDFGELVHHLEDVVM